MPDSAVRKNVDTGFNQNAAPIMKLDLIRKAPAQKEPYPHVIATNVLPPELMRTLNRDFPDIKRSGYLPLSSMKLVGVFAAVLKELEGPELAAILTEKLGVELRDKPSLITIRKWSAKKDGNIHND